MAWKTIMDPGEMDTLLTQNPGAMAGKTLLLLAPAALLALAACSGQPAQNYGGVNYGMAPADWARANAGGPGSNNYPINPSATSGGGGGSGGNP